MEKWTYFDAFYTFYFSLILQMICICSSLHYASKRSVILINLLRWPVNSLTLVLCHCCVRLIFVIAWLKFLKAYLYTVKCCCSSSNLEAHLILFSNNSFQKLDFFLLAFEQTFSIMYIYVLLWAKRVKQGIKAVQHSFILLCPDSLDLQYCTAS